MLNCIIFDLEATCWRGRPPGGVNEIIEIGAVKLNRFGEYQDVFNTFIRPTLNPVLSSFCTELTSITQRQVGSANTFPRVLERFHDWINVDEDYALCSWGDADRTLFTSNCRLHRLDMDWLDNHIDLKNQYHRIKDMNKFTGLKTTLDREGFEFEGKHHRAISDAENLCKIFVKYIDDWELW